MPRDGGKARTVTRLAIIAAHFPEYTLRYAAAMARHCDVLVVVDSEQLKAEYAGRSIELGSNVKLETCRFKNPADLWRLFMLVRKFQPGIVHVQEAVGPRRIFSTLAIASLMKRRALIALTVHDPVPHSGRDQATMRRFAWMSAHVRRIADIVVVHGAFCANAIRSSLQLDRQRLIISDHGLILEPSRFGPPPLSSCIKLYTFGRMEAYKGIEVLLDMAKILHAESFPFELTIAGRGPEMERLAGPFGQLPEVRLLNGFVSPNDAIASIQEAECVMLPYLNATQSGVLAAAFAGRRYVIASRIGGIPDIVSNGENGLLVPAGDATALAEAVKSISRDPPLRARLRAGAIATAQGRLNWDVICDNLFAEFMAAPAYRHQPSSPS